MNGGIKNGPFLIAAFACVFCSGSHTLSVALAPNSNTSTSPRVPPEAHLKRTAQNLLSVSLQIQKHELYSPQWADACTYSRDGLVTSRNVEREEVLSLYPMHAIGLRGLGVGGSGSSGGRRDWIAFDADRDGGHFGTSTGTPTSSAADKTFCHDVPLLDEKFYPYPTLASGHRDALFIDVNPTRPIAPGWLGHLANHERRIEKANCIVVPLPGAAPLCALVSTSELPSGERLFRREATAEEAEEYADRIDERYYSEISELRSYMNMAYQSSAKEAPSDTTTLSSRNFEEPFHTINRHYSGLRVLRSSPDVLVVDNFLSDEECDRLIVKARPHLVPCLVKNADTGAVEEDPNRTSTNTNVRRCEVPSIVSKLVELANCDERQLEILQVLRYTKGQQFRPHTDGFSGPINACGFQHSGRLVTIFCYLCDTDQGGETRFTKLGLDIVPRKRMAVVHFPNTVGLEEDLDTEHEGATAVDEKWLLVTWVWKHYRSDKFYDEKRLDKLGDDII